MNDDAIMVIGAGGHARVVADALIECGRDVVGFIDSDPHKVGTTIMGRPVAAEDKLAEVATRTSHLLVNGIGGVLHTRLRKQVQERLETNGWRFTSVRHPSAILASQAKVSHDSQLLAGSIVQAGARAGRGNIVNTGAIVEHDCVIDDWVHLAPAATLCGNVTIGAGSVVGARAVIIQGIRIGADTLVGAGAVVIRDFDGDGILHGVPARPVGAMK